MIAGDFVIIRIGEPKLSVGTEEFLREHRPIGVHFAREAFRGDQDYLIWLDTFRELRAEIQEHTGRNQMIWSIDHEGGRVNRLPAPITRFSYPLNWQAQTASVGKAMGKELRSLAINLLFGPSLDIFSHPDNRVIGPRSFGRDSNTVHNLTTQFILALREENVLATVKHFPGHGDTKEDSHFELPTLRHDMEFLRKRELVPFERAIQSGIPAVMLAHILFPEVDKIRPSSLSPIFAKKLLREEMGFDGVSITDDLDMKAVSSNFSPEEIASGIVESEINLCIFNHSLSHAGAVAGELGKLIAQSPHKIDKIERRTHALMGQLSYSDVCPLSAQDIASHQSLSASLPEQYEVKIKEFEGA